MYGICLFLTNCVEGRARKLDGAAARLPFCQRISRQAEAKVFTIMCVTDFSLSLSSWEEEGAVKRRGGEFFYRKFLMPIVS
jgi:hypothetical protein